jgi:GH43 family beta-xylosidase
VKEFNVEQDGILNRKNDQQNRENQKYDELPGHVTGIYLAKIAKKPEIKSDQAMSSQPEWDKITKRITFNGYPLCCI